MCRVKYFKYSMHFKCMSRMNDDSVHCSGFSVFTFELKQYGGLAEEEVGVSRVTCDDVPSTELRLATS